jgi:hypothetical protein
MKTTENSFVSTLTIVFITLKLTGHISWAWAWVVSPFFFNFMIKIAMLIILSFFESKNNLDDKKGGL